MDHAASSEEGVYHFLPYLLKLTFQRYISTFFRPPKHTSNLMENFLER